MGPSGHLMPVAVGQGKKVAFVILNQSLAREETEYKSKALS
jgi:hypothetical protein